MVALVRARHEHHARVERILLAHAVEHKLPTLAEGNFDALFMNMLFARCGGAKRPKMRAPQHGNAADAIRREIKHAQIGRIAILKRQLERSTFHDYVKPPFL